MIGLDLNDGKSGLDGEGRALSGMMASPPGLNGCHVYNERWNQFTSLVVVCTQWCTWW